MVTYVALSSLDGGATLECLGRASTRTEAEQVAYREIDRLYPDRTDIYNDTLRANLHVMPFSKARRLPGGLCVLNECEHDHGLED